MSTKLGVMFIFLPLLLSIVFIPGRIACAQNDTLTQCQTLKNYDEQDPKEWTIWNRMQRCQKCGDCKIDDFILITINLSRFILGIVGSLALLFFVYGGMTMILSSGNSERVETAKAIIKNAVIGLVLVFVSWMVIDVTIRALIRDEQGKPSRTIFKKPWYELRR